MIIFIKVFSSFVWLGRKSGKEEKRKENGVKYQL